MPKALIQDGSFKSKKRKIETLCILCNEECSEKCKLQEVGWNSTREKAKAWIGLDTLGTVSETVDWGNGPEIYLLHNKCKLKLHNERALDQGKKRKEKKDQEEECKSFAEKSNISSGEASNSATITTRRSSIGLIHSKDLCIWCMKPKNTRHKDRTNSKLHLINQVRPL